jgi:serine/threonine-protein kinase
MPKPGDLFAGRYSIERLLGRGGMGEVWLAVQSPLARKVALKVLKPPQSIDDDPNFDARFLREAAAAARLTHPNTITVFDFGQTDEGQLYIVMEYLEGNDLRTLLAHEGILPPARALHIAKQVCKSLREAHGKGIIHRDLKPANVLLIERDDDHDFVKVLDFGLVKFRGETSEITLAGKFLGSPRYTSPEALDRQAEVDHRADVYAVGILVYTMITGAPPFDGDPMQVLNAHLHEKPRPMYRANPASQTSPELEALVARCLEKEPGKRYAGMQDLLKALREVGAFFGDEETDTLDLELSEAPPPGPAGAAAAGAAGGSAASTRSVASGGPVSVPASRPPSSSQLSPSRGVRVESGAAADGSTVTRALDAAQGGIALGRLAIGGLVVALLILAVVLVQQRARRDGLLLMGNPGAVQVLDERPVAVRVAPLGRGGTLHWRNGDGAWVALGPVPWEGTLDVADGVTTLDLRLDAPGAQPRELHVPVVDGVARFEEVASAALPGSPGGVPAAAGAPDGTASNRSGSAAAPGPEPGAPGETPAAPPKSKPRPKPKPADEDPTVPEGYKDNPY